jgi:hypothetical protein
MPSTCDLKEAIEAFQPLFDPGLREHLPNYTKPDLDPCPACGAVNLADHVR